MITSVTIQEFIYKLLYDFNVPKYEGKEFRNKFNEYISPNKWYKEKNKDVFEL